MKELLTVLHTVTAVFLVGPMAMLPMTAMRAVRAGNAPMVSVLGRSTRVFGLASLVVAVLGFGVLGVEGKDHGWTIGTGWVLASVICYLVALGLTLLLVVPALRAAAQDLGAGGNGRAAYPRVAAGSGIATLLLIAVVVLMVWRP